MTNVSKLYKYIEPNIYYFSDIRKKNKYIQECTVHENGDKNKLIYIIDDDDQYMENI